MSIFKIMISSLLITFISLTTLAQSNPGQGELSEDLFEQTKWYSYQFQTHYIWTNFDVYMIQHQGERFKLQILSFYHPDNKKQSGFYTLRIENEAGVMNEISFEAAGCGHPMQNPNYANCKKDPQQNAFTYLDLKTLNTVKMTDDKGLTDTDWAIGFKAFDIKLNSGKNGPSDSLGQLLYRDPSIMKNGKTDFKRLLQKIKADNDLATFQMIKLPESN